MQFENRLIEQYLTALRAGDLLDMARIEAKAADYDAHNPEGRLLDQLAGLTQPAAA
ncbi:hypothetical protein [Streptomyces sp. NPDC126499]|uniref:hypothetical protein n=1 Tax=Streptomyces sp. NPDC126499 TaxID=3155314 RepID=UPI00332A735F